MLNILALLDALALFKHTLILDISGHFHVHILCLFIIWIGVAKCFAFIASESAAKFSTLN